MPPHYRVRQDKVNAGKVTLRYKSQPFNIAVGREYNWRRVLILAKVTGAMKVGVIALDISLTSPGTRRLAAAGSATFRSTAV